MVIPEEEPGVEWPKRKAGVKTWGGRVQWRKPLQWLSIERSGKELLKLCVPPRHSWDDDHENDDDDDDELKVLSM